MGRLSLRRHELLGSIGIGILAGVGIRDLRTVLRLLHTLRDKRLTEQTLPPQWIVIPALNEGRTLVETARHLHLICGGQTRITVCVNEAGIIPELKAISEQGICDLIISKDIAPSKAALIDLAIAENAGIPQVTLYDADSRPISVGCELSVPHLCQQLSIYQKRQQLGRSNRWEAFWEGVSLNQSLWSLGAEARMLARPRWLYYLVGHGLQIPTSIIEEIGFRPELPGEDLYLGYQLCLRGMRAHTGLGLDVAQIPCTFEEFIEQAGRWFLGETTAIIDIIRNGPFDLRVVRRVAEIAWWPSGPPVVIAALLATLRSTRPSIKGISVVLTTTLIGLRVYLAIRVNRAKNRFTKGNSCNASDSPVYVFLGFMIKPTLSSMGAFLALIRNGPAMQRGKPPRKARLYPDARK